MITVSDLAGFVLVMIFFLVFAVLVYVFVKILIAISKIPPGSGSPKANNQRDTRERWDSNTKNPWYVNWQEGTLEDRDGNIVGDLDDRDDD